MNRELGLNILSRVMNWTNEVVQKEFRWISFMAAYKYDRYQDFCAGARFLENLITWLQQFQVEDRQIAYDFVKDSLIFFSQDELQHLIEKFYFDVVQPDLVKQVSQKLDIPHFKIWANEKSEKAFAIERRKTLFMGLSDGAHLDVLRRMHSKTLSNEQFVITTQIDKNKWRNLLTDLQKDLFDMGEQNAAREKFSRIYLIDDFVGSGTSLLRNPEITHGKLKGKLEKFATSLFEAGDASPFIGDFRLTVHHYVGTMQAQNSVQENYEKVQKELATFGIKEIDFNFGMLLDRSVQISDASDHPFTSLCKKYYDQALDGKRINAEQSGILSKMFGYAGCGLPVVFEHNTPNNSLPLIWAETKTDGSRHAMRPLFRRRERHSDTVQELIEGVEERNG